MLSGSEKSPADLPFYLPALMAVAWVMLPDANFVKLARPGGPGTGGPARTPFHLAHIWTLAQPQSEEWPKWYEEPAGWKPFPKKKAKRRLKAWRAREPDFRQPHRLHEAMRRIADCGRAGRLPATAMRDGQMHPLRPEDWAGLTLDVVRRKTGEEVLDLCRVAEEGSIRCPCEWTEVHFHRDTLLQLFPALLAIATTVGAEQRVKEWIKDQIRASPHVSPKNKNALHTQAEVAGHKVSNRAFERARAAAITEMGAVAWSKPGRKRTDPNADCGKTDR